MTFSVVARCAETGAFGVAISSSSPAVAARCSYAQAGVGAVASQNVTDPTLGPATLSAMAAGKNAAMAIEHVRAGHAFMEYRQLLAVDGSGGTAIHSGPNSLGIWTQAQTTDVACGGNLLDNLDVPEAMVAAFVGSAGSLGDRLLLTLKAGLEAGGEAGPVHSAGLKLVDTVAWPVADLRIDWSEDCPIEGLEALWQRYKPQMADYVLRASDPSRAPSYGVAGDEG